MRAGNMSSSKPHSSGSGQPSSRHCDDSCSSSRDQHGIQGQVQGQVSHAFHEQEHPRDEHGRFIPREGLEGDEQSNDSSSHGQLDQSGGAGSNFEEKHPRDKHGRFIHKDQAAESGSSGSGSGSGFSPARHQGGDSSSSHKPRSHNAESGSGSSRQKSHGQDHFEVSGSVSHNQLLRGKSPQSVDSKRDRERTGTASGN
jgi:hypothetical protein